QVVLRVLRGQVRIHHHRVALHRLRAVDALAGGAGRLGGEVLCPHERAELPGRVHRDPDDGEDADHRDGQEHAHPAAVPRRPRTHCRSREIHCRSRKMSTGETKVEVSTRLSGMNGRNLTSTNDTSQVTVTDTKTNWSPSWAKPLTSGSICGASTHSRPCCASASVAAAIAFDSAAPAVRLMEAARAASCAATSIALAAIATRPCTMPSTISSRNAGARIAIS